MPVTEKLQKILASAGIGSRRQMEQWIIAGRISVDGKIAALGDRVERTAQISIDGKLLPQTLSAAQHNAVILIYHKPVGEMCTRVDPEGRPTVFARLPKPPTGRWVMIGRLDYNTSGLLLFTNDGELAHRLLHPSFHLQRVYAVRVFGKVNAHVLARLQQGVRLSDGMAHFDSIEKMTDLKATGWYKVSLTSGRNRIVRRLFESQNIKVNRLTRIQFGPLVLPNSLIAGQSRLLTPHEQGNILNTLAAQATYPAVSRGVA